MIERARFYRNGETNKTLDIRLVTGRCAFREDQPRPFQDLVSRFRDRYIYIYIRFLRDNLLNFWNS